MISSYPNFDFHFCFLKKTKTAQKMTESWTVYILRCEQGKYYVGRTKDLERRLADHLTGGGAVFTSKYPPVKSDPLIATYVNCSTLDEDKYVKATMMRYGIDNVRGGSYSSLELSKQERQQLEKELRGAQDCCFKCGQPGHFVNKCPQKVEAPSQKASLRQSWEWIPSPTDEKPTDDREISFESHQEDNQPSIFGNFVTGLVSMLLAPAPVKSSRRIKPLQMDHVDSDDDSDVPYAAITKSAKHDSSMLCIRCGRNSHNVDKCYAKTHLDGTSLTILFCKRCHRTSHRENTCRAKTMVDGSSISH